MCKIKQHNKYQRPRCVEAVRVSMDANPLSGYAQNVISIFLIMLAKRKKTQNRKQINSNQKRINKINNRSNKNLHVLFNRIKIDVIHVERKLDY